MFVSNVFPSVSIPCRRSISLTAKATLRFSHLFSPWPLESCDNEKKFTICSFRYRRVPLRSLHSKRICYVFFFFFHNLPQDSLHDILNFAPTPPHKCLKNFPRAKTWFFLLKALKKRNERKKKKMWQKYRNSVISLTLTLHSR